MLIGGGKVIFGSDSSGRCAESDPPFHSVPGVSVDHSLLLGAPLPSE